MWTWEPAPQLINYFELDLEVSFFIYLYIFSRHICD